MDTSLTVNPKPVAIGPATPPELQRQIDTKVPRVEASERSATLPTEKPFVAQVVSARLSGTEFPENPGTIAPPERVLRPYDTPMLPADKPEEVETGESLSDDTAAPAEVSDRAEV